MIAQLIRDILPLAAVLMEGCWFFDHRYSVVCNLSSLEAEGRIAGGPRELRVQDPEKKD